MTIREAINLARQLKQISPTNYPDALMLQFINECEGKIQTEFLRISEIDCQRYTEDDLDKHLIVSPPHDKLYYTYLCAMIDFTNGEYNKYQNAIVIANSFMAEWAAWFNRTHRRDGREYQGVFLSAYGIAVKWGYQGTEEEWLASLEGPQGPPGASLVSVEQTVESTEDGGRNEIVLRYGEGEEDYAAIFVRNGQTGKDGLPGPAGADGKSPTISVEEKTFAGDVVYVYKEITVTNPDGTTETFELWNGKPGPAGAPGKVFCPVIDDDGNLSWRVYNGNDLVPMPPTVNIKGPKGDPGDGSGGGVSKASELDNDVPFVSADEQSLTEDQKAQARENIGVESVLESVGGDTLTWDGNTEGLVSVADSFYKVSDLELAYSEAVGATCMLSSDPRVFDGVAELAPGLCLLSELVFFITKDVVGVDLDGLMFPEPGIYMVHFGSEGHVSSLTIPGYTGFAKKKIKTEYIPESVPQVQTAAVGQTVVVSEVDAEGKPTRWEAVEFAAGGGGEEWELIVDYTVPETVNGLTIDKDLSGNPFELRRWLVLTIWLPVEGVTINHEVKLGFNANCIWGNSLCQTFSAPTETETMAASLALCGVVAGNQIVEHYEQAQNRTNVAHQLRVAAPNPVGRPVTPQGEFESNTLKGNATCLKLSGYQTGCIHAGSIVKMWGVRV